ncbi:CAP domain-containing protein [bacterium]|nr:CAP domain-containing protein [bacterium]
MEWKMLRLVNKDRKQNGLKKLRMQEDLRVVARKHSKDMAQKDYFEHKNLLGETPFDRLDKARITDIVAGENLAKIKGYQIPVRRAEIGLMNSPGHRANILKSDYNCVGIGIVKSQDQSFYFTQNFAERELVFTKKIKKVVRLKTGLNIKGYFLKNPKNIIYQVKNHINDKDPLYEKLIKVKDRKFNFVIPFSNTGIYQTLIFVETENGSEKFNVVNKFEIKVRKGFVF